MDIRATLTGIAVVLVMDWLGVTRIGSFYTTFDYRYWPLSKARLASLTLLMVATALLMNFPGPGNAWVLAPFFIALVIWAVVALRDVYAQRDIGHREPPQYGVRVPDED